ncbi:MAG: hypothetical protein K8I29_11115 [Alphaproteobacteria bacterium]|uniref:DUF5666 domain-containing protein n=1 Tax=Candidatus Nitrobium versatile TaxID=2884831 RepID=A0A953JFE7_9BACT|nr:hypothetical protein [Candidatus Nitrobium versatile]
MRGARVVVAVLVMALFCVSLLAGAAVAAEKVSVKGKVKDYDVAQKTVTVTVDGKDTTFVVENETVLKKLDDRIVQGDEVKVKYTEEGGKNVIKGSNDLKGTKAGC